MSIQYHEIKRSIYNSLPPVEKLICDVLVNAEKWRIIDDNAPTPTAVQR